MKLDFSRMLFPVEYPGKKKYWEQYPRIARRIELSSLPPYAAWENEPWSPDIDDLDKMVRMIALMVDPGSPLFDEPKYDRKLDLARDVVGVSTHSRLFVLMKESHWWYQGVLTAWFLMFGDDQFTFWWSLKVNAHQLMEHLRADPNEAKDSAKAITLKISAEKSLPGSLERIAQLEEVLFPDAETMRLVRENLAQAEVGSWAEVMAIPIIEENEGDDTEEDDFI